MSVFQAITFQELLLQPASATKPTHFVFSMVQTGVLFARQDLLTPALVAQIQFNIAPTISKKAQNSEFVELVPLAISRSSLSQHRRLTGLVVMPQTNSFRVSSRPLLQLW